MDGRRGNAVLPDLPAVGSRRPKAPGRDPFGDGAFGLGLPRAGIFHGGRYRYAGQPDARFFGRVRTGHAGRRRLLPFRARYGAYGRQAADAGGNRVADGVRGERYGTALAVSDAVGGKRRRARGDQAVAAAHSIAAGAHSLFLKTNPHFVYN